jgi:hypothetical protein
LSFVRGTDALQRQLRRLSRESEATIKDGLARLAHDVRDEVQTEVGQALDYSNANTRRFVAESFRVKYSVSSVGVFTATIYPLRKAAEILLRHVQRWTNRPADKADVLYDGKMLVPIDVSRGGSGKIPKALLPENLLERDARGRNDGFVTASGRAIMLRQPGAQPLTAFALVDATTNPKAFDVQEIATRAVRKRAGKAFAAAIRESMRRAGVLR